MFRMKYIALGFDKDAEKLINEFVGKNTAEFSVFLDLWKKHEFSLIFLGRPNEKEHLEFTREVFRLSASFLLSSSLPYQIGGLYLLYGIYRTQTTKPPIRARITLNQWQIILKLREEAVQNGYKSLHFVIDYLIENGLDFVAHPTLMGPKTSHDANQRKRPDEMSRYLLGIDVKSTVAQEKNLESIHSIRLLYEEEMKKLKTYQPFELNNTEQYESCISSLQDLEQSCSRISSTKAAYKETKEGIGNRRSKIKTAAFTHKVSYRIERESNDSDDPIYTPAVHVKEEKKIPNTRKRLPRRLRKIGRPRKIPIVEPEEVPEESDSEEVVEAPPILTKNVLLVRTPPRNKRKKIREHAEKPKRRRFHYTEN